MHIAILTFEGFNELDSLIAYAILNRIRRPDWHVSIASPAARVMSMNGLVIDSQIDLQQACAADAVIVGSGMRTREVVADQALMAQLRLDPARQLLAAQCSGTLVLARLGLLDGVAACTDLTSKPWVEAAGVAVLDQPLLPVTMSQRRVAAWRPPISPPGLSPVWSASTRRARRCTTWRRWGKRRSTWRGRWRRSVLIFKAVQRRDGFVHRGKLSYHRRLTPPRAFAHVRNPAHRSSPLPPADPSQYCGYRGHLRSAGHALRHAEYAAVRYARW